MTNTITISFLLELRGYFCSGRYINNENTMHESACRYRHTHCPLESSYLLLSIIFAVPRMYTCNIIFVQLYLFVPYCSYSKIGKNMGTLGKLSTYKKETIDIFN